MYYLYDYEIAKKLKEIWDEDGVDKSSQFTMLELMDIAARDALVRGIRRIALCLVDEGLSPEKIKRITGCDVEELERSTTLH